MNDKKYLIALNFHNPNEVSIYMSEVNFEPVTGKVSHASYTLYDCNAMRFPLWLVDNVIDYLTTLMINRKDVYIRSITVIPVDE